MRKSFAVPTLKKHGTIVYITGTGCVDLGWDDEKNLGYPSDTNWKFFPSCDQENGGGLS